MNLESMIENKLVGSMYMLYFTHQSGAAEKTIFPGGGVGGWLDQMDKAYSAPL